MIADCPTSNSDRPLINQPNHLFHQIKQRSPLTTHKPDRISLCLQRDSPNLKGSTSVFEVLLGSILREFTRYIETWFNSIIQNVLACEVY